MPDLNNGTVTLFAKGRIGVLKGGAIAVNNKYGRCPNCCPCKPYILAHAITNSQNPVWDLTPYQGKGIATMNNTVWRLKERGAGLIYGNGNVSRDGELLGLPNSFRTSYSYDGFMELQLGCTDKNGNPLWPS
ncbi:MAG: hypothetical protein FWH27_17265 [Planctomycetaceae bacterium]|nr:hypothetical protein [Planctomycetaceae bacterium]